MQGKRKTVDVVQVLEALGIVKEKWLNYNNQETARAITRINETSLTKLNTLPAEQREVV